MRDTKNGPVVDGEGWFVVNARDSRWREMGPLGAYCNFEGKRRFPNFGINLNVLGPGERIGMYHRENAQEAFLVLAGECTLVVEDEERQLTAWDFFYCAPGTPHIIVTGEGQSAVVLAVGGRGRGVGGGLRYLVSEVAARHGASVAEETTDASAAYADVYADAPAVDLGAVPRRLASPPRPLDHFSRGCHSNLRTATTSPATPHATTTATAPRSWTSEVPWRYAACMRRIRYVSGSTSATAWSTSG